MTLIKLIILVAISYCCCCSLISCASGGESEVEAGPSTGGNADSDSQRAELHRLGTLLFMTRNDFDRKKPRILETNEVRALLNQYENLQERVIAGQPDSQLQISQQTDQNQQEQPQNRWTNSALQLVVGALQGFISLAEEENEEEIVKTCESLVSIENVREARLLIAEEFPIISKFTEEYYQRIIKNCEFLVKSRLELFLSMLGEKDSSDGRNFAQIISSSMNKLKLFGSEGNEELKQMALAEAAARFVEFFGGPGLMRRHVTTNQSAFKNYFRNQSGFLINPLCEKNREIRFNMVFDAVDVLLQIEPVKLKSLRGFDEYKDLMSVSEFCQYWPRRISLTKVYSAHLIFQMDLRILNPLKRLNDDLFSPSASRISDPNVIESKLKHLRDEFASKANYDNEMFRYNVHELNVILGIRNRISEYLNDKEIQVEHGSDSMQKIEPFIRYYESIEAHNIVFYLNSLINQQTGDSFRELEEILRTGNEELANYPQINANLRELR